MLQSTLLDKFLRLLCCCFMKKTCDWNITRIWWNRDNLFYRMLNLRIFFRSSERKITHLLIVLWWLQSISILSSLTYGSCIQPIRQMTCRRLKRNQIVTNSTNRESSRDKIPRKSFRIRRGPFEMAQWTILRPARVFPIARRARWADNKVQFRQNRNR